MKFTWNTFISMCAIIIFMFMVYNVKYKAPRILEPITQEISIASPESTIDILSEANKKSKYIKWMLINSEVTVEDLEKIYDTVHAHKYSELIFAIMYVESRFHPYAKSEKGAMGLLQVMPDIWLPELKKNGIINSKRELYSIEGNIASGLYVFEKYLKKYGTLEITLNRYVGGSKKYVSDVLSVLGTIYVMNEESQLKEDINVGQTTESKG